MVFARSSSFLHNIQPAGSDVVAIWQKSDEKLNQPHRFLIDPDTKSFKKSHSEDPSINNKITNYERDKRIEKSIYVIMKMN